MASFCLFIYPSFAIYGQLVRIGCKLYTKKTATTSADMLNDKVIPFFDKQDISLFKVLTDRGTEYCCVIENHAYQLYLVLEDIDHIRTKTRSSQTNGIYERFHRTLKDEFYDITFRKKNYNSVEELQSDLDEYLRKYIKQDLSDIILAA